MRTSNATLCRTARYASDEPLDLACVNLDQVGELNYWLRYFDTTESQLYEAVSLMGTEVPRVRAYLRRFR